MTGRWLIEYGHANPRAFGAGCDVDLPAFAFDAVKKAFEAHGGDRLAALCLAGFVPIGNAGAVVHNLDIDLPRFLVQCHLNGGGLAVAQGIAQNFLRCFVKVQAHF